MSVPAGKTISTLQTRCST